MKDLSKNYVEAVRLLYISSYLREPSEITMSKSKGDTVGYELRIEPYRNTRPKGREMCFRGASPLEAYREACKFLKTPPDRYGWDVRAHLPRFISERADTEYQYLDHRIHKIYPVKITDEIRFYRGGCLVSMAWCVVTTDLGDIRFRVTSEWLRCPSPEEVSLTFRNSIRKLLKGRLTSMIFGLAKTKEAQSRSESDRRIYKYLSILNRAIKTARNGEPQGEALDFMGDPKLKHAMVWYEKAPTVGAEEDPTQSPTFALLGLIFETMASSVTAPRPQKSYSLWHLIGMKFPHHRTSVLEALHREYTSRLK